VYSHLILRDCIKYIFSVYVLQLPVLIDIEHLLDDIV